MVSVPATHSLDKLAGLAEAAPTSIQEVLVLVKT